MTSNSLFAFFFVWVFLSTYSLADQPNIILMMTDDQGWGQTGYNGHPLLKTPNLDAMADGGLRFNRFYAAAPVCSPTRASHVIVMCSAKGPTTPGLRASQAIA